MSTNVGSTGGQGWWPSSCALPPPELAGQARARRADDAAASGVPDRVQAYVELQKKVERVFPP